tara:strand:- start:129 stop:341 length:213 start_codon:yes stop_codon:yes gene_type:complete
MAKRGRPKSKPIPKWNPKYSKISVRVALQNALSSAGAGYLSPQDKKIINQVLEECDQKVLDNQNLLGSDD